MRDDNRQPSPSSFAPLLLFAPFSIVIYIRSTRVAKPNIKFYVIADKSETDSDWWWRCVCLCVLCAHFRWIFVMPINLVSGEMSPARALLWYAFTIISSAELDSSEQMKRANKTESESNIIRNIVVRPTTLILQLYFFVNCKWSESSSLSVTQSS